MTAAKPRVRNPGPVRSSKEYPHGTKARYNLNGCRCDECRADNRRYERKRLLWLSGAKVGGLVDAAPVRRHVMKLQKKGMGYKRIADLAGVPQSAVGAIIWGRYDRAAKRVKATTAAKLLAVGYQPAGTMKVPGDEARAIIAELQARGWWKAAIGRRIHGPHAKSLQVAKVEHVEAWTLVALRGCLDEPTPKRKAGRGGGFYQPKGRPPRPVAQRTPGMYTEAPAPELVGNGSLRCKACDKPLAFHMLGQRCA